jgi:hypothetical protein
LINFLKRDGRVALLQQLKDVERLGEDGNQVQPLDLCHGVLPVPAYFPKMEDYPSEYFKAPGYAL